MRSCSVGGQRLTVRATTCVSREDGVVLASVGPLCHLNLMQRVVQRSAGAGRGTARRGVGWRHAGCRG